MNSTRLNGRTSFMRHAGRKFNGRHIYTEVHAEGEKSQMKLTIDSKVYDELGQPHMLSVSASSQGLTVAHEG